MTMSKSVGLRTLELMAQIWQVRVRASTEDIEGSFAALPSEVAPRPERPERW